MNIKMVGARSFVATIGVVVVAVVVVILLLVLLVYATFTQMHERQCVLARFKIRAKKVYETE